MEFLAPEVSVSEYVEKSVAETPVDPDNVEPNNSNGSLERNSSKKFLDLSVDTNSLYPYYSAPATCTSEVSASTPAGVEKFRRQAILDQHKYCITRKIDDGSYGEVFEAKDTRHGDKVAIKRIGMATQHTLPQDVVREIASLTRLASHPLVVDLKKVFVYDNDVHLVLSYHESTLHDVAQDFVLDEVRNYSFQLLVVVDHLWREGMLHRDIKPENILVGKHGILKLADFGHSNCTRNLCSDHIGTRDYRAPELMFGCDEYDVRAEVWSVACTMYFLFTGRHLFDSKGELELLRIQLTNFGFPGLKDWPALSTYRKYEKYSLIVRLAPYRRGVNLIAKLISNHDKGGTWTDDQDIRSFTALLSCMLMPNPANRPLPAPLLEHEFFAPVWRAFVDPNINKQLHFMRQAMQWNPRASMNVVNVRGMPFYGVNDGDSSREVHFAPLREAFRRIVCQMEKTYPLSLQVLLEGLDVVDHLVADNGWNVDRLLVHHVDPNAGYVTLVFACVFIVFKYYEDYYHDLALDTDSEAKSEDVDHCVHADGHTALSAANGEGGNVPECLIQIDGSIMDGQVEGADDHEPQGIPLAISATESLSMCVGAETSDAEEIAGSESDDEGWETASTMTSSSSESDSSAGDPDRQGRIDDVSDALEIRLKDVLACERIILETIGLEFLNRPTLHRQLEHILNKQGGDQLHAAQYLCLLALQDQEMTTCGLQAIASSVAAVLNGIPPDGPFAGLGELMQAEVLPYSLVSRGALDMAARALEVSLPCLGSEEVSSSKD